MVTIVSGMPRYPAMPNAQITPTSTTASGSRRQRTLNSTSRMSAMIATAIAPRVSIPPVR